MDTQPPAPSQESTTQPVAPPVSEQPIKSKHFMRKTSRSIMIMIVMLFLTIASGVTAYFVNKNSIFKSQDSQTVVQTSAIPTPISKPTSIASVSPTTLPTLTSTPTPTSSPQILPINFTETGNLVNYDSQTESNVSDWTLLYEKPGNPAISAKLAFSEASLCDLGEGPVSCDKSKLTNGDRAKVEGNNNNGVVTVIKLTKL